MSRRVIERGRAAARVAGGQGAPAALAPVDWRLEYERVNVNCARLQAQVADLELQLLDARKLAPSPTKRDRAEAKLKAAQAIALQAEKAFVKSATATLPGPAGPVKPRKPRAAKAAVVKAGVVKPPAKAVRKGRG